MAERPDDAIEALVKAASGIDIVPELLARVPEAAEYVDAWRKTLIDNGSLREESPTNEFLGVLTVAATWIANGSIAARVRAELKAEEECVRAACQQIAATASDVYCQITDGLLSYPTYDARTILSHAEDATQKLVDGEVARVRAEERRRLLRELAALAESDGEQFIVGWLNAVEDGEFGRPAAGSVPVATPPAAQRTQQSEVRGTAHGTGVYAELEAARAPGPARRGSLAPQCGLGEGSVATPTEPRGVDAVAEARREGWMPFGTLVDVQLPSGRVVQFSDELDEAGLPLWERIRSAGAHPLDVR